MIEDVNLEREAGVPRFVPGDRVIFYDHNWDPCIEFRRWNSNRAHITFSQEKYEFLRSHGFVATIKEVWIKAYYVLEGAGNDKLWADCWIQGLYDERVSAAEIVESDLLSLIGG